MRSIFRRVPDSTDNYTDSHKGRGSDYDANFDRLPFRSLMWEMEQKVLVSMVRDTRADLVVDLACGTGRISALLSENLPRARIVGVDVAETMLNVARQRVPDVDFRCADVRGLSNVVADGSVDLMTAFRFFPNADSELRSDAARAAMKALRPGGFLLLNNHRNFWSSSYIARRALKNSPAPGALNRDVVGPFLQSHFRLVTRKSLGVVPHSDDAPYLLSPGLATKVERLNEYRASHLHRLGTNTIWLLQKANNGDDLAPERF